MIKEFLSGFCHPDFFELDPNREYTNKELFNILENENLTLSTGNAIMLSILKRMNDKIENLPI